MMHLYEQVFHALAVPDAFRQIAVGEIRLRPAAVVPFTSEGYPPALIPLWSHDFGYYGLWQHWFCNRTMSIVELELGEHMHATEVARSLEQFILLMVLEMVCGTIVSEEDAKNILLRFGLDVVDFDQMIEIAERTGDDCRGLAAHRRFINNVPLNSTRSPAAYRGDFPVPNQKSLHRKDICGFELPLNILLQDRLIPSAPWLAPPNSFRHQRDVFYEFLRRGDLGAAWLSINSPAWEPDEMRAAMKELNERAGDKAFSKLVAAWSAEQHGLLA